jgi:membrane complex biogenesis BtpA family protein
MVHLLPLPGSPRACPWRELRSAAKADAKALARGGVDGLLIENYGDAPFSGGGVEAQVVATMAVIAEELRTASGLPIGINILRNDARSALAVALASGASFIRVNVHVGAAETDQGRIEGKAYETLRYRKAIGASVALFADVFVKHAQPAGTKDLAAAARETAYRGLADALLVTGSETGVAPTLERLVRVREAVPDRPVWVASGVDEGNVREFQEADGLIVGSAFERGGRAGGRVEEKRVRALLRTLRSR